jgi:hypothetical protein
MLLDAGVQTSEQAVDYLLQRLLTVAPDAAYRRELINFLDTELGTSDLQAAASYMEESLRMLVHLIMSAPEYQLG